MQFPDPEDFIARWLDGLLKASKADSFRYDRPADHDTAARRLVRMLKSASVRKYTFTFLRRNFYRQLDARTRAKPPDDLWGIQITMHHTLFVRRFEGVSDLRRNL